MKDDYKDNDCESVMKKFQLIVTVVGLLIFIGGVNSSFAATVQVQTNTTFTCTDNADCKAKCKALTPPGTWKPNPGGVDTWHLYSKKPIIAGWQNKFRFISYQSRI